jgi:predicted ester cyclase
MQVDEAERTRRRKLLRAHLDAENEHDASAVMATFADGAIMHYNAIPFATTEAIRTAHEHIGFSRLDGAFAGACNVIDRESFTDLDIVIEGRLFGTHKAAFMGLAPSGRKVELPFVAFYTFDQSGKLSAERVVMNLGPLLQTAPASPGPGGPTQIPGATS